jgi:hypothetical protein
MFSKIHTTKVRRIKGVYQTDGPSACPVYAESSRLYAGEFDAPFRLHFLGDRLGEALNSPFRGTVYGKERNTSLP